MGHCPELQTLLEIWALHIVAAMEFEKKKIPLSFRLSEMYQPGLECHLP